MHLWDTERLRYPWLDEVPLPRRVDAAALTAAADPVAEFVLVQADCVAEQALAEIAWLSEQAALLSGVRGIVGYAPLHDPVAAAAHLRELRRFPLVVGVRRLIQDEPPGFTSRPGLRAGVALLAAEDLVFDLCVREPQLGEVGRPGPGHAGGPLRPRPSREAAGRSGPDPLAPRPPGAGRAAQRGVPSCPA